MAVIMTVALATYAQVPATSGSSSGAAVSIAPVGATSTDTPQAIPTAAPDLSMLESHAKLVAYQFKKIRGVSLTYSSGSQSDNWNHNAFFDFTNDVKSLDAIADMIKGYYWDLRVTDPKDYVQISVKFVDADSNSFYSNGEKEQYNSTLFQGWGGGVPVIAKGGGYVLPDWASTVNMMMSYYVRIPITGAQQARLIVHDANGNSYGINLSVRDGFIEFPSEYAGANAELVIGTAVQTGDGWQWVTHAYSITTGLEVEISDVMFRVLLADSEDFKSFKNPSEMIVSVNTWRYNGVEYGKVPLLMATFETSQSGVMLSVYTRQQVATKFILENQATGVKTKVFVPEGATGVSVDMPKGVYYIYPEGISLQLPNGWYYGGKG